MKNYTDAMHTSQKKDIQTIIKGITTLCREAQVVLLYKKPKKHHLKWFRWLEEPSYHILLIVPSNMERFATTHSLLKQHFALAHNLHEVKHPVYLIVKRWCEVLEDLREEGEVHDIMGVAETIYTTTIKKR